MTITQNTRRRVYDAIPAKGATLRQLSATSGVHLSNVRMSIRLLADEGKVLTMRAGTGEGSKHEVWVFLDEQSREAFEDSWLDEVARRQKARIQAKEAARKAARATDEHRSRVALAAEAREAKRRAARELERAERARIAEQRAEEKKSPDKKAAAAPTPAPKPAPKPKASAWADMPMHVPDDFEVTEVECKLAAKHEAKPDEVPPMFSSLRPGQYIAPAPAWLQGVTA